MSISIPDSVRERIESLARENGVSANVFVEKMLARQAALADPDYIRRRAARGSAERMLKFLAKVPNVEPDEHDRL